jgi:hypothetical protein
MRDDRTVVAGPARAVPDNLLTRLTEWSSTRRARLAAKILADAVLLAFAYQFAFVLRFDGQIPERFRPLVLYSMPLIVLTKIILLYNFHLYHYPWRFTGVNELVSLVPSPSR